MWPEVCSVVPRTPLTPAQAPFEIQPARETTRCSLEFCGAAVYSYTLHRDAAGRITGKTETVQATTVTSMYDYDAAGRVSDVSVDGQLVASYGYDANGNRVARTAPTGTEVGAVDDQDRLLAFGSATYPRHAGRPKVPTQKLSPNLSGTAFARLRVRP